MKTLSDVYKLAEEYEEMCERIGIDVGEISNYKINSRAKKRWGQCSKNPNGTFTIEISNLLLQDDVKDMALENTLMHEILHTVDGCFNHGAKWKMCADMVNNAYGFNVKRCTSSQEKGIVIERPATHYVLRCKKCGYKWNYSRMSKTVKHPENYKHNDCGGTLERWI